MIPKPHCVANPRAIVIEFYDATSSDRVFAERSEARLIINTDEASEQE